MSSIFLVIIFCVVLFLYFVLWGAKSVLRSLFSGGDDWVKGTRTREGEAAPRKEGEVTIRQSASPQPKRVSKDVGDYVDYEEEKTEDDR